MKRFIVEQVVERRKFSFARSCCTMLASEICCVKIERRFPSVVDEFVDSLVRNRTPGPECGSKRKCIVEQCAIIGS